MYNNSPVGVKAICGFAHPQFLSKRTPLPTRVRKEKGEPQQAQKNWGWASICGSLLLGKSLEILFAKPVEYCCYWARAPPPPRKKKPFLTPASLPTGFTGKE
jgi:hypothetical protein